MSQAWHLTSTGTAVLLSAGGAVLEAIVVNGFTAGAVITVYDNDAASGEELAIITPTAAPVSLPYGVTLKTGLTVVTTTQAADLTVVVSGDVAAVALTGAS